MSAKEKKSGNADFQAAVIKLLEEMAGHDTGGKVEFTDKAKEMIHEIAGNYPVGDRNEDVDGMEAEYTKGLTAEEVYYDMISKISCAPTYIHAIMTARWLIPVVSKKLKEQERQQVQE